MRARVRAFAFAIQGLKSLFLSQCHARFHALAALVVIALGFSIGISANEWCMVILAVTSVLSARGSILPLNSSPTGFPRSRIRWRQSEGRRGRGGADFVIGAAAMGR